MRITSQKICCLHAPILQILRMNLPIMVKILVKNTQFCIHSCFLFEIVKCDTLSDGRQLGYATVILFGF
ncbi:unnamed protein product [Trichobilharzia regenti]|nr:unnamed protein product [Trichobilharzia regenti]